MRRFSLLLGIAAVAVLHAPAFAATSYPLELDNCGFKVSFAQAPERVVTIKSTATEMLLALGLGSRIVGIGFQDGPVPDQWQSAAANLKVLAEKMPSQEVVLETEPDLVYGGWESNFAADAAGERAKLGELGIASYVSPAACRTAPYQPVKLSFDDVFAQIEEMGSIFDVTPAAETLVASQRTALAAVAKDARGLTAVWYSSGTKAPYVGAGAGAPEMMLEQIGLKNIMASTPEGWISASWEAVVDANPNVIVLVDSAWNSAAQKKKLLAENPITSGLDAVKNQRYLIVPFPASEAGVRSVDATADLAAQLAALSF